MIKASIIIPTLNESNNVNPLLERLTHSLDESSIIYEIIFVDNGSQDGTVDEIIKFTKDTSGVKLVRNKKDEGLAQAVLVGVDNAKFENIVVMDADLSHPPEIVPDMITTLVEDSYDMVIGSRYTEGGSTPDWPLKRRLISKIATFPARLFSDVSDPLSGLFAVKKEYIKKSHEKVRGFKLGFELLAVDENEMNVCELPITFRDREYGKSKMNCSVVTDYLKQLVELAGGDLGFASNKKFIFSSLLGFSIDFILCYLLLMKDFSLTATHLLGFGVSGLILYGTTRLWHRKIAKDGAIFVQSRFLRIFLLFGFIVAIRGGVLAACQIMFAIGILPSIILTLTVSHLLSYFGNVLFVFPSRYFRFNRLINWRVFSVILFGYFVLLRLFYLGTYELLEEEAYYWNYAQHIDIGYLDHPPVVSYLIWIGTFLFGDNEFGVRFGAMVASLVTAFFVYKTTLMIFGRSAALVSMLLVSVLPFYFGTALLMTPDASLTACWAGTLYYLYRVFIKKHIKCWIGVAICLGVGMASKYTIVFLGPAIVAYMLLEKDSRKWFFKPHAYITAISAFVIFSPVIIWNMNNEWASFLFQSKGRINDAAEFTTHELLGSILILITPVAFATFIHFLMRGRKYISIGVDDALARKKHLFFLVMTLAPLSIFLFFSFTKEVKFNWTGPLWLAMIPYFSWSILATHEYIKSDKMFAGIQKAWPGFILFTALLIAFLPHYLSIGLPNVPYLHGAYLAGWSDLAKQVEEKVRTIEKETGERPMVVGMDNYQIASGLAFYRHKLRQQQSDDQKYIDVAVNETTSWGAIGHNGLMYNYWTPPESLGGKSMLLVASLKRRSRDKLINLYGTSIELADVEKIPIHKNGILFGAYYSRYLKEYSIRN